MQFKRPSRVAIEDLPSESVRAQTPQLDADSGLEPGWCPVSKTALGAWLAFYVIFLIYAAFDRTGFLLIDYVNLPIHEAGHLLFGILARNGQVEGLAVATAVAGGTALQLAVPLLLAVYFTHQRHATGTAFCSFFFFENFLNIATYMADARCQQLTLVTVGDGDNAIHDWFYLFSHMHVLEYDQRIASLVRLLAWVGMMGTVLWLIRRDAANPEA